MGVGKGAPSGFCSPAKRFRQKPVGSSATTAPCYPRVHHVATSDGIHDNLKGGVQIMANLDWSQCPAVESVPGRRSGAWVFKDTRMPVATVFETSKWAPA